LAQLHFWQPPFGSISYDETDRRVNLKKALIYTAIACCNGIGDVMLKRGMTDVGTIHLQHWQHVFTAIFNPWIILGIACLAGFFYSYLTALSWADLSYVLPATALGYVVTTVLSRYFLFEQISPWRWSGVLLISFGVGLVTRGPSITRPDVGNLQPIREEEHEFV
jgi:drug/metabolite transporter (DMT)-like permease